MLQQPIVQPVPVNLQRPQMSSQGRQVCLDLLRSSRLALKVPKAGKHCLASCCGLRAAHTLCWQGAWRDDTVPENVNVLPSDGRVYAQMPWQRSACRLARTWAANGGTWTLRPMQHQMQGQHQQPGQPTSACRGSAGSTTAAISVSTCCHRLASKAEVPSLAVASSMAAKSSAVRMVLLSSRQLSRA